jgi:hypothetical protein
MAGAQPLNWSYSKTGVIERAGAARFESSASHSASVVRRKINNISKWHFAFNYYQSYIKFKSIGGHHGRATIR